MHNSHVFPQATRMLLIGSLLLTGELTVNARGGGGGGGRGGSFSRGSISMSSGRGSSSIGRSGGSSSSTSSSSSSSGSSGSSTSLLVKQPHTYYSSDDVDKILAAENAKEYMRVNSDRYITLQESFTEEGKKNANIQKKVKLIRESEMDEEVTIKDEKKSCWIDIILLGCRIFPKATKKMTVSNSQQSMIITISPSTVWCSRNLTDVVTLGKRLEMRQSIDGLKADDDEKVIVKTASVRMNSLGFVSTTSDVASGNDVRLRRNYRRLSMKQMKETG
ncbi:hypothetical protein PRIPAC_90363 [Pristionchus pacificus]|uniref:Uncharacterized protein n=1 Tax=Pristionchus pacificus TaxID=54126 RepID=A0A2A6B6H1_PRIPA|nr:hypothetical protein PRIPAC_90363 [Pristionchus pacificus]|eukprot:PDM61451.1 hypothetical protein PRIPAC_50893 [Pristionchus pacificus]